EECGSVNPVPIPSFALEDPIMGHPVRKEFSFRFVWLLVFCIAWGDMILLPYAVQASRVLTIVVFLVWLVFVLLGQAIRLPTPQHIVMLLFVVWSGASLFSTEDSVRSLRRVLSYCQLFLDAWLIYQCTHTVQEYCRLLRAYLLGCYVAFAGLVYNFMLGDASG